MSHAKSTESRANSHEQCAWAHKLCHTMCSDWSRSEACDAHAHCIIFQLAHTLAHARVPQSPNSIPNKIGSIQPLLCTTHLLDISGDPIVVTQAAAQSPPKPHPLWRAALSVQFSHPLPQTHFRIVAIPVSRIVDKQTNNLSFTVGGEPFSHQLQACAQSTACVLSFVRRGERRYFILFVFVFVILSVNQ